MKAAFYRQTGVPEVIQYGDLPMPQPRAGQVLVRVEAAALNPIDTYIRSGAVSASLPVPFIPGCDLAGTVESIGPECRRFKVGDRVWGSNQGLQGRQGTFAEFAAVHEDWLYPIPEAVSAQDAVAVALTGITAHLGLFQFAKLQPNDTVFVNGGTGGVGSMVVKMAKAVGARAIATVGSAEKVATCRSWGTDCVINYKSQDVATVVREFTGNQGVNVWYETLREPDFFRTVDLMAPRGRIVIIAGRQAQPTFPVGPFYVKGLALFGFAMFNMTPEEQRRCSIDINDWLAQKKLRPNIDKVFPFRDAAAAHRLQEENTIDKQGTLSGKIVLVP